LLGKLLDVVACTHVMLLAAWVGVRYAMENPQLTTPFFSKKFVKFFFLAYFFIWRAFLSFEVKNEHMHVTCSFSVECNTLN
jgi:hypothetical protein